MSDGRESGAAPRSLLVTVPGVALQLVGTLLLPLLIGVTASLVLDTAEVVDTLPALLGFASVLLAPVLLAQVLGLAIKSWREIGFHHRRRSLTPTRLFDILFRHVSVVTARGWSLLLAALGFVVAALSFQWASLGLLAVLGLFLFYAVVGWTILTSTFLVRSFERGIGRSYSGIERELQPAVCVTGADANEVFRFRRVPIPWGYFLLVEERLPPRLGGESRYLVGAAARSEEVERRGRIPRTQRGVYRLGPAQVWYQDLLGITRISVASLATAELKVLPRIRPVQIIEPPHTSHDSPDVRTVPHRLPTEDWFRFRGYLPGDDTRRIHWKLSMRTGAMQVRQPETRETTRRDVLIVIDTWLPRRLQFDAEVGADDLLDQVVDAALGLTRHLVDRGDRVRLACAATRPSLVGIDVEVIDARAGNAMRWQDIGARVRWQSSHDLPRVYEALDLSGHALVVTARFTPPPADPEGVRSTTWVFVDPASAIAAPASHWTRQFLTRPGGLLAAALLRRHPAGSEENAWFHRVRHAVDLWRGWHARVNLRRFARARIGRTEAELVGRGDGVYRIEQLPGVMRLRGISRGAGGAL